MSQNSPKAASLPRPEFAEGKSQAWLASYCLASLPLEAWQSAKEVPAEAWEKLSSLLGEDLRARNRTGFFNRALRCLQGFSKGKPQGWKRSRAYAAGQALRAFGAEASDSALASALDRGFGENPSQSASCLKQARIAIEALRAWAELQSEGSKGALLAAPQEEEPKAEAKPEAPEEPKAEAKPKRELSQSPAAIKARERRARLKAEAEAQAAASQES